MLTKTNSWLRAGALTVLGLGLSYSTQSFTEKEEVKPTSTTKVTATVWRKGLLETQAARTIHCSHYLASTR